MNNFRQIGDPAGRSSDPVVNLPAMQRTAWKQDRARLYEASEDGVIRISRLEQLGVHPSVAYARCRPGGPWQRLLPGVVLLHSGPPSWRQRLRAALMYAGRDALVTGAAACELYGLRSAHPQGSVHLLIPHQERRISSGFAVVERTTRLPVHGELGGFAVAPAPRAVLDLCRRLTRPETVQAVLTEAVQKRCCTPADLVEELDEGSRRGTAIVRHELTDVSGGARSVAEIRAVRVHRRSGLPEPLWNVTLTDQDGNYVGMPDGWFADVGLAWEIESHEFHMSRPDHARSLKRDNRYAAYSVVVHKTLPSTLEHDPVNAMDDLRGAYRAAALRPAPQLVATPA